MARCTLFFLLALVVSPLAAVAQEAAPKARPVDAAFIKRLAEKVEPKFQGRRDRLAHYVDHFRHETANDARLFAFHVSAAAEGENGVRLHGFVEFPETRAAIGEYFKALGFAPVENDLDTLPAKELGERRFGFITAAHSLSYAEPEEREVVTDCLLGEPLFLLREEGDHFLVHGGDGYLGYVAAGDVKQVNEAEFADYLTGPRVCVLSDQTVDGATLPAGSRLKLVRQSGDAIVGQLPSGEAVPLSASACEVRDAPSERIDLCARAPSDCWGRSICGAGRLRRASIARGWCRCRSPGRASSCRETPINSSISGG